MSGQDGTLIIGEGTILRAKVSNCRQLEVAGYVDGEVETESLVVHRGGRCYGTIHAGSADVSGTVQGRIGVRQLIHIHPTGDVSGSVRYGRLSMDAGGSLSAEVRNVPPSLAGDFELSVLRGGRVQIRSEDLHAVDPDDASSELMFAVSNPRNGHVAAGAAINRSLAGFTQADLDSGRIYFVHDGNPSPDAGFDVVVSDHTGATSGAPQPVHVSVRA
jgi:cytoskeletal protein CcmA (bactofilin family)